MADPNSLSQQSSSSASPENTVAHAAHPATCPRHVPGTTGDFLPQKIMTQNVSMRNAAGQMEMDVVEYLDDNMNGTCTFSEYCNWVGGWGLKVLKRDGNIVTDGGQVLNVKK